MTSRYHNYQAQYAQNALRGVDITPRPELAMAIALQYASPEKTLLDIGCGTAEKTLTVAQSYKTILGLEPSLPLIRVAQQNIQHANTHHAFLIRGVCQHLPLQPESIDVITAVLTWQDPSEIHNIIKKNGVVIIEGLGPEDKTTFTSYFGKDEQGYRGARLNTSLASLKESIYAQWSPYFSDIQIFNQHWQTAYTPEGLWDLLCTTYATVRNFDPLKDKPSFDKAITALAKEGNIILTQNRLVTVAQHKII